MRRFSLTCSVEGAEEKQVISGNLSDEDEEDFIEFLTSAERLFQTSFLRKGANARLVINHDLESGKLTIESQLPPDDELFAFLHLFRPFYLQDRTFFNTISNKLKKILPDENLRMFIDFQKEVFKGSKFQESFNLRLGEDPINSDELLRKWLNAYEYHKDKDKKKQLDQIHKWFPLSASKVIFIHMLTDKVVAINNLCGLIATILGKQNEINLVIRV